MAFGHRLAGGKFFYVGDDHLVRFSVLFVVVYLVFFCGSIFHGENCKTKSPVLTANSSFYFFKKLKISENVLQKSL